MQHKNIKIINSFKELSSLNTKSLFKNYDTGRRLKPLDKKFAVSMARQISTGFDIDLRKQPSKSQYKRARKVITEYLDATQNTMTRNIRPTAKNRALYAEISDLPKNFKVFPVPVQNPNNKFKIVKRKGKKKLVEKGKNITYEYFLFNDTQKQRKKIAEKTFERERDKR